MLGDLGCVLGGQFRAEVKYTQDAQLRTEAIVKLGRQLGIGVEVQLHAGEAAGCTVETISSSAASTKTPIFSMAAGRCGVIPATCTAVNRRGLGAKTKPTASAPASAATSASLSVVLPQILIHRLIIGSGAAPASSNARAAPGSGWRIMLSPIRKASKPAVRRRTRSARVLMPLSVTLTTPDRNPLGEFQRGFQANLKGMQVAIVHADGVGAAVAERREHTLQFVRRVHLDQHVKRERMRGPGKVLQLVVRERGGDQQDSVGVVGAGFEEFGIRPR